MHAFSGQRWLLGWVIIDLTPMMVGTEIDPSTPIDAKLDKHPGEKNSMLHLAPIEWRLLLTR